MTVHIGIVEIVALREKEKIPTVYITKKRCYLLWFGRNFELIIGYMLDNQYAREKAIGSTGLLL